MSTKKEIFFSEIKTTIQDLGFEIEKVDIEKPWGGFFVIKESDGNNFVNKFFPDRAAIINNNPLQKISPKILLVAPGKKLSWQYHYRRAENWKLIQGEAGIIRSATDEESELTILKLNETVMLQQGERHRLVGLQDWGVVAEIWIHTDFNNPSNEDDIVRLSDDYGRSSN